MGDTDLLVSLAFSENDIADEDLYRQIMNGRLALNEGMLHENAVAQELVAHGSKLCFYTHYSEEKHRNDIEVNFLISDGSLQKYRVRPSPPLLAAAARRPFVPSNAKTCLSV